MGAAASRATPPPRPCLMQPRRLRRVARARRVRPPSASRPPRVRARRCARDFVLGTCIDVARRTPRRDRRPSPPRGDRRRARTRELPPSRGSTTTTRDSTSSSPSADASNAGDDCDACRRWRDALDARRTRSARAAGGTVHASLRRAARRRLHRAMLTWHAATRRAARVHLGRVAARWRRGHRRRTWRRRRAWRARRNRFRRARGRGTLELALVAARSRGGRRVARSRRFERRRRRAARRAEARAAAAQLEAEETLGAEDDAIAVPRGRGDARSTLTTARRARVGTPTAPSRVGRRSARDERHVAQAPRRAAARRREDGGGRPPAGPRSRRRRRRRARGARRRRWRRRRIKRCARAAAAHAAASAVDQRRRPAAARGATVPPNAAKKRRRQDGRRGVGGVGDEYDRMRRGARRASQGAKAATRAPSRRLTGAPPAGCRTAFVCCVAAAVGRRAMKDAAARQFSFSGVVDGVAQRVSARAARRGRARPPSLARDARGDGRRRRRHSALMVRGRRPRRRERGVSASRISGTSGWAGARRASNAVFVAGKKLSRRAAPSDADSAAVDASACSRGVARSATGGRPWTLLARARSRPARDEDSRACHSSAAAVAVAVLVAVAVAVAVALALRRRDWSAASRRPGLAPQRGSARSSGPRSARSRARRAAEPGEEISAAALSFVSRTKKSVCARAVRWWRSGGVDGALGLAKRRSASPARARCPPRPSR